MPTYLRIISIPLDKSRNPSGVIIYRRDYVPKPKIQSKELSAYEKALYLINYPHSKNAEEYYDEVDDCILKAIQKEHPLATSSAILLSAFHDAEDFKKKYEEWYPYPISVIPYELPAMERWQPNDKNLKEIKLTLLTPRDISIFQTQPVKDSPLSDIHHPRHAEYEELYTKYSPLLTRTYPIEVPALTPIEFLLTASPLL